MSEALARAPSAPHAVLRIPSTPLAFWGSRILIWAVGCVAVLALGTAGGNVQAFDPTGVSSSFGHIGNVLAAPAVRWDSIWYLLIAQHGYQATRDAAFYPLYPMLVRALSVLTGSLVTAAIAISVGSMFGGLVLVRRLTELELGEKPARTAVLLIAFGPMAVFLSAVYTESLFLMLSAGTIYAARRGRWALAGALGGLASLSRVEGVLLAVPVLILFFYGPRDDLPPRPTIARWRPRYRFAPAVLWSALIPAGAACFSAYLALRGFGLAATAQAQEHFWNHRLVLPVVGVWDGVWAAWHELQQVLGGVNAAAFTGQELLQLGFLAVAGLALIGVFRRLPLAYGVYAALALLLPLSSPTIGDPLRDFDRYASVVFPLFMWAGEWAVRRHAVRPLLVGSTVMLVFCTAQFATWHWVGSRML
jgi:hypothetical protein